MLKLSSHAKMCMIRAANMFNLFQVFQSFNNAFNKRLTIVTYHRVTDTDPEYINSSLKYLFVNVNSFEKQVLFFRKYYNVINFIELKKILNSKKLPKNLLLITFDDGYEDFFDFAYPILRKYKLPATIFVVPGKINAENKDEFWWDEMFFLMNCLKNNMSNKIFSPMSDDIRYLYNMFNVNEKLMFDKILDTCSNSKIEILLDEIRKITGNPVYKNINKNSLMGWEQIRNMSDVVEVGSHTLFHQNMKFMSEADLEKEVLQSKLEIEDNIHKKVIAFSYPYGFYNSKILSLVQKAGYLFGVTTEKGINDGTNLFLMKRINLWERSSSIGNSEYLKGKFGLILTGI